MSKIMAIWNQTDREITTENADNIFKASQKGLPLTLPPISNIEELHAVVTNNSGTLKTILSRPEIVLIEVIDVKDVNAIYDILFYAIDNDMLLYDASEKKIMCAAGRYGIGDYVLTHEDTRIVDNPTVESLAEELARLDEIDNTFAIFEGPLGYVQTAYEEDSGYTVEWNRGNIDNHYILEKGEVDFNQVLAIFSAFLNNDVPLLKSFGWCKMEFKPDDFSN